MGVPADHAGVAIGWAADDEDSIGEGHEQLQTQLRFGMGDFYVGPTANHVFRGDDAVELVDEMIDGSDDDPNDILDHYLRVRNHLTAFGGVLLVCAAPGTPAFGNRPPNQDTLLDRLHKEMHTHGK